MNEGDTVVLEYTGTLEDGSVFDATTHGDHTHPLEFVIGSGNILPSFEKEIITLNEGDEKTFTLTPKDAYGEPNPAAKQAVPRSLLPKDKTPEKGMTLMMGTPDGKQFPAKIADVTDEHIVLDLNHPLAGKTLTFKVKVVKVTPKK